MLGRGSLRPLAALGMLAFAGPVDAGDKPDPPKKSLTAAECERLVEAMVNPGKAPFKDSYVHDLPGGVTESKLYDTQRKIGSAYNKLSAHIEDALPVLAKHLEDRRFSYVYEDGLGGVYLTATVGTACRRIIEAHVEVYREAVTTEPDGDGRTESLWFLDDGCGGIEKWWKGRRGRKLADLQSEGIEWALHQPRPKFFTKREWARAQKSLEKLASKIRSTGRPIPVEHEVQFFSR